MNQYLILPTLKDYLCGKRKLKPNSSYILRSPKDLCAALNSQNITIQYHPKNEKEKKELIDIINFLNQRGKDVTVTEFERIFDDDLLLELANRNVDFKICLRYMLESYHSGYNFEMEYSLEQYQEIIRKVKYFCEKVEEVCVTEEEKIIFTMEQLATYIKYPSIEGFSDFELTPVSDFYASIGKGEAICAGYSMALWKILTELRIPCHIILGAVSSSDENMGHAWNQVYMNEVWYNVDLTWFSSSRNIEYLLQDDENFPNHYSYRENKVEKCLLQYSRERIISYLEKMKNYPNFFIQYDKMLKENGRKMA